jgi:phosphatidylglycerol lysyltransferase
LHVQRLRAPDLTSSAPAGRLPEPERASPWVAWAKPLAALALLALAARWLHRELVTLDWHAVLASARAVPGHSLLAAATVTALSYWILGLYDVLGLRYAGKQVVYPRALFVSFIANAFAHNLGLASLTGAAIRFRLYAASGLTALDIATVSTFGALTTGLGLATLAAVSLLSEPERAASALHLGRHAAIVSGGLVVTVIAAYIVWASVRRAALKFRGWQLRPPGSRVALTQWVLGTVDFTLSAAALWFVMPSAAGISFVTLAGAYALAVFAGLASSVPGGVGVFEGVILLALPHPWRAGQLGALLVYRLVYYLAPLGIAALLFAASELGAQRARLARVRSLATAVVTPAAPWVASSLVFLAGCVLLISGATPEIDSRLQTLNALLPLPVLELSHLAASCIGAGLLIVARGLSLRVNAAYQATLALLAGGIAASLMKGIDVEEAALLTLIAAILWLGRGAFYRPSSLFADRLTPAWIVSVAAVLALALWIGFLAQRHVEYSHQLWWTFALTDDAPRMLRASLAAALLVGGFLFFNLLKPRPPDPNLPDSRDLEAARDAIARDEQSLGNVALTGDKRLLFGERRDAFIMYQIHGRSWVALGDPVGPRESHESLVWEFRSLVDRHGGWTVFHEVSGERLPLYVDLGLAPLKMGEEARVALPDFSLHGSARAELRQSHRRAERDGATFHVLPPERIWEVLPQLHRISDAWLAEKATAEKRFSVGAFAVPYLSRFHIALVRVAGRPVAFANVWMSGAREELSVDLMRFDADAPRGVMDYLFTELMLWGRAQGFRWFNLGMAPLAGLERRPLAPLWHRVGNFLFAHGEHFYNFEGLRRYKSKFAPTWQPRYLVAPGGWALPRVLVDVSLLIAGGARGLMMK